MKMKMILPIGVLLAVSILVSGCAAGLSASSWPSLSADATNAYLAEGPYVYAVNLQTGAQAWVYPSKASSTPFYATPVLTTDGQLIVGGFDHKLYSLNLQTGAANAGKWPLTQAKDKWIGGALVVDNMIFAPNADYNLYALDLKGNAQWTFQADQALWAAPASDGQLIYLGTLGRKVYAVNAKSGVLAWEKTLDGAILGSPVVAVGGLLYVNTYSGKVVALSPATGEIRWQHPVSSWIWSGPVLDGSNIYTGDSDGMFYSLNASSGKENWHQKLNGAIIDSALVTPNSIIVGTDSGTVYFLDRTGAVLHTASVSGKVYTQPVFAGGLILVAPTTTDSKSPILVAYDQNGTQKWSLLPQK